MKKTYMKALAITACAIAVCGSVAGQNPIITKWEFNNAGQKASYNYYPNFPSTNPTTGVTMTDSAGITKVCYNTTSVYVRTDGLPDFVMGTWTNPNVPSAQNNIFKFPLNPTQNTGTLTAVPTLGYIAVAVDGSGIYGVRSADSYNNTTGTNSMTGNNVWHADAWVNEGSTMDATGAGHPDMSGVYHYHATPSTLYSFPSSSHSPIIGFSFDGYPIYGPYGYTSAMNSSSGVSRMTSSYQLRNITVRTTLPDGSTASSPGPNVSTTFPLGSYVEDYEFVNGLGTLDEYNGRFCVTPEYPSGTYAYFITVDNAGSPAYPYILAEEYYGVVNSSDIGSNGGNATIPSSGTTCIFNATTGIGSVSAETVQSTVYPNPGNGVFTVELNSDAVCTICNALGQTIFSAQVQSGLRTFDIQQQPAGVYFVQIKHENGENETLKLIKE